jgi:hypothetical protein
LEINETLLNRFLFVFELWQTAEDVMVLPCDFTALKNIGPEKWPIFGRLLTSFPLKHPARREKILPTWRRPSVTSRAS